MCSSDLAAKKTATIARDASIDTATGLVKNSAQYPVETFIKGQQFSEETYRKKTTDALRNDFLKNSIKASVKMDSKTASYHRFNVAHTYTEFRVNPDAVVSRLVSNANERASNITNRALTWMIGIDISKLKI